MSALSRLEIEGEPFLRNLRRKYAIRWEVSEEGGAICCLPDLKFDIRTREDLYILNEVFVVGCYDLLPSCDRIVIDVGMNTGMASLFFARQESTLQVYGFEPLRPTFELALRNFALNSGYSRKIVPAQFGLGKTERSVLVDYFPEHRGSLGVHGLNPFVTPRGTSEPRELVVLNASRVLSPILEENSDRPVLLKLDCEGSEYEIVEDLFESGLLSGLSAVLCEWHLRGPEKINEFLRQSGFTLLNVQNAEAPIGMIYALKSQGRLS